MIPAHQFGRSCSHFQMIPDNNAAKIHPPKSALRGRASTLPEDIYGEKAVYRRQSRKMKPKKESRMADRCSMCIQRVAWLWQLVAVSLPRGRTRANMKRLQPGLCVVVVSDG